MIRTILEVEGMMCGMCEAHVNDAVRAAFPEAKKVTSSRAKKRTEILSEVPLDPQEAEGRRLRVGLYPRQAYNGGGQKGLSSVRQIRTWA